MQRMLESLQTSLEAEAKGRAEAMRLKKKHETEATELEIQLEHANRSASDNSKQVKRLHQQVKVRVKLVFNGISPITNLKATQGGRATQRKVQVLKRKNKSIYISLELR